VNSISAHKTLKEITADHVVLHQIKVNQWKKELLEDISISLNRHAL
jgi:hypothetical protein